MREKSKERDRERKEEFSTKMTMIIPEHTPPTTLSSASSLSLLVYYIYI
jgi:hypothetical protein